MVKIKLNRAGVRELMQSAEIVGECERIAQGIAARAGDGYTVDIYPRGKTRGNASVIAETDAAMKDNMKRNTLLKAIGK